MLFHEYLVNVKVNYVGNTNNAYILVEIIVYDGVFSYE